MPVPFWPLNRKLKIEKRTLKNRKVQTEIHLRSRKWKCHVLNTKGKTAEPQTTGLCATNFVAAPLRRQSAQAEARATCTRAKRQAPTFTKGPWGALEVNGLEPGRPVQAGPSPPFAKKRDSVPFVPQGRRAGSSLLRVNTPPLQRQNPHPSQTTLRMGHPQEPSPRPRAGKNHPSRTTLRMGNSKKDNSRSFVAEKQNPEPRAETLRYTTRRRACQAAEEEMEPASSSERISRSERIKSSREIWLRRNWMRK